MFSLNKTTDYLDVLRAYERLKEIRVLVDAIHLNAKKGMIVRTLARLKLYKNVKLCRKIWRQSDDPSRTGI